MRIGLYGMPTAGKTYILDRIDFLEVIVGSKLLRQYDPDFDKRDEEGREHDRREVAKIMMAKTDFIMDGHYAFGDEIAFTEDEGEMYDVYLYLYIDPQVLTARMEQSAKNQKYLKYDIAEWQEREICGLRSYCHTHNKDFYIIDNPPANSNEDVEKVIEFIRAITQGHSCLSFAKHIVSQILAASDSTTITLLDGDKTLTIEDSSGKVLGYKTHLYDGNFYTGYQAWKQDIEFQEYCCPDLQKMPVHINQKVMGALESPAYILTSGHQKIWRYISSSLELPCFSGIEMSAETKYFVTKMLQANGKRVIAYGDGMNDYYMLCQADEGYLVTKSDGTLSRSLSGKSLEGLILV